MRFFQPEFVSLYDLPCPISLEEYKERTQRMRSSLFSYSQEYGVHYELCEDSIEIDWSLHPSVAQCWSFVKDRNFLTYEKLKITTAHRVRKWMLNGLGALTLGVLPVVIDRLF